MTNFIINMLTYSTYLSAALIIFMGCLVTVCLLLYPVWFLFNKVIYRRTEASAYFISYIKNRKKFLEWKKDNEK
ncbi:hypothetical protein ABMB67_001527 [Halalkalibacter oceani]